MAALAAAFMFASLPAAAGSGQRQVSEWMQCVSLEIVIDTTLRVHDNAIVHRMTKEELSRFGPADEGAWFEREDAKTVYVVFFRGGCLEALRNFARARFDRLLLGTGEST